MTREMPRRSVVCPRDFVRVDCREVDQVTHMAAARPFGSDRAVAGLGAASPERLPHQHHEHAPGDTGHRQRDPPPEQIDVRAPLYACVTKS